MTRDVADVHPPWRDALHQVVGGLTVVGIPGHTRALAAVAGRLPRDGATPAAAVIGAALAWDDQTALTDDRGSLTYRQLGAATLRLAAAWSADATIRPGSPVAILADDDRALLMAVAAASLCGADVYPFNPRIGSDDLTECLAREHIETVIHAPGATRLDAAGVRIVSTAAFDGIASRPPIGPVPHAAKRSRLVMLTSGTTAAPSTIRIRRRSVAALPLLALAGATGVQHGAPMLICAPLFHGYGLACAILGLVAGVPLILGSACRAEGMSALHKGGRPGRVDWGRAIYDVAARESVMTIIAVPAQLRSLAAHLDETHAAAEAPRISSIVSGADRLDERTLASLQRTWGAIVTNYYGTTESGTTTMIGGTDLACHPTSVGRPVAGSRVRVVDEAGLAVGRGVRGRVQIVSPMASVGSRRAGASAYTTSDIGWVDADGYLYLDGRVSQARRAGGEFVNETRVAAVLESLPGVAWATARMVPDDRYGQRVAASIATHELALDAQALRDEVRARLGPASVPVRITVTRLNA